MVDKEQTPDGGKDTGSRQPEAVFITPPQSVSVKNSMPKDGVPLQIVEALKNVSTQNGKEEK